ncbi:MAG: hypothetical protein DRP56_06930 [Planctomycetota bacterium]|nr:MAG: hypothetical protein DRP56_06930 [Planctomycetota bacterium]
MAVLGDIIDGTGATITDRGWELSRIAIVSELSGVGHGMLNEAVIAAGVNIGDAHPTITTAYVREILPVAMPRAANQVKITYLYREFDTNANYAYQLSGDVSEEETTLYWNHGDSEFKNMELEYTFPGTDDINPDYAGKTYSPLHSSTYLKPRPTIRITRFETLSIAADDVGAGVALNGDIIVDRQIRYIGKVNSAGWNLRPSDGLSAWLCVDISASKQADQVTWQVTYVFQYDTVPGFTKGWASHAQFIDPNTGQPPDDLIDGTGNLYYTMYPAENFSLLQLS